MKLKLILFLLSILFLLCSNFTETFLNLKFSDYNYETKDYNLSHNKNILNKKNGKNGIVYQSNGIPLKYEEKNTVPFDSVSKLHTNYISDLRCCPSSFSTDKGCVCYYGKSWDLTK